MIFQIRGDLQNCGAKFQPTLLTSTPLGISAVRALELWRNGHPTANGVRSHVFPVHVLSRQLRGFWTKPPRSAQPSPRPPVRRATPHRNVSFRHRSPWVPHFRAPPITRRIAGRLSPGWSFSCSLCGIPSRRSAVLCPPLFSFHVGEAFLFLSTFFEELRFCHRCSRFLLPKNSCRFFALGLSLFGDISKRWRLFSSRLRCISLRGCGGGLVRSCSDRPRFTGFTLPVFDEFGEWRFNFGSSKPISDFGSECNNWVENSYEGQCEIRRALTMQRFFIWPSYASDFLFAVFIRKLLIAVKLIFFDLYSWFSWFKFYGDVCAQFSSVSM